MIELRIKKKLRSPLGEMLLDIDTQIDEGSFVTLYGPSGAGKTTLLRILAGLSDADQCFIQVGDDIWSDSTRGIRLQPKNRNVGLVFQDYALFPNMTVEQNLQYALQKGKPSSIIDELLDIIALGALKDKKPHLLSGGQQQRVALARSLVQQPQLLLLDEPLSALDLDMRQKLQSYLREVHQTYGHTTIMISHDPDEILRLSDITLHMHQGRIMAQDSPALILRDYLPPPKLSGRIIKIDSTSHLLTVSIGESQLTIPATAEYLNSTQVGMIIEVIQIDGTFHLA